MIVNPTHTHTQKFLWTKQSTLYWRRRTCCYSPALRCCGCGWCCWGWCLRAALPPWGRPPPGPPPHSSGRRGPPARSATPTPVVMWLVRGAARREIQHYHTNTHSLVFFFSFSNLFVSVSCKILKVLFIQPPPNPEDLVTILWPRSLFLAIVSRT